MNASAELLRCPFCGNAAAVVHMASHGKTNYPWMATCISLDCAVSVGGFATESEGIAAWNRRAPIAASLDGEPVPRSREDNRARFPDPDFNRWMDEGISDAGHTVYDTVADQIETAWLGWEARNYYGKPVCTTCGGHGLVGGFIFPDQGYQDEPCPDCTAPPQVTPTCPACDARDALPPQERLGAQAEVILAEHLEDFLDPAADCAREGKS